MRFSNLTLAIGCFVLFSFLFVHPATSYSQMLIEIDVAPNVLNIQSEGTVVTVHTDIPCSLVEPSSVTLSVVELEDVIELSYWKADSRGNFVAKFSMDEVKLLDLLIGDYNKFLLEGFTKDEESFTGSQKILVIDVLPRGE